MFVRLYPNKFRPAPDGRAAILARPSHAGYREALVKARGKTKTYSGKVFDQTFFKKFVGCGAKPHDLQPYAQSPGFFSPPPPGGGGVYFVAGRHNYEL
jgi:hypothetical protein